MAAFNLSWFYFNHELLSNIYRLRQTWPGPLPCPGSDLNDFYPPCTWSGAISPSQSTSETGYAVAGSIPCSGLPKFMQRVR